MKSQLSDKGDIANARRGNFVHLTMIRCEQGAAHAIR